MMQISKEKAINLIMLGLAIKYVPLIATMIFAKTLNKLPFVLSLIIFFLLIGLLLVGYIFFIKGCCLYTKSKGYSSKWGWLGLLSIFGLSVILLIPNNKNIVSTQSSHNQNLSARPFSKINIPELTLSYMLAIPVILYFITLLFCLLNNWNFSNLTRNLSFNLSGGVISYFCLTAILFNNSQEKTIINNIFNYKNNLSIKLALFFTIITYAFRSGLNSFLLYNLSFIFTSYVEYFINKKPFTNISEILLYSILSIVLAPLIGELLFRGIILQKWSIKWGVKSGVLTSSLLFAVLHLDFNSIIPLFIEGIMLSSLYFQTRNLLTPIFGSCFYSITVTIHNILNFFSKSLTEREAFISVRDYQNSIQPLLGQRVLLIALTVPLIAYFIYKYFPKDDATLPYYDSGS